MKEIYLDNAATTFVTKKSAEVATDIMTKNYGNPSSIHNRGFSAEKILKGAREDIAKVIGAEPKDIYFTSGATEANNIAILGAVRANARAGKHIITTKAEHSSVLKTIQHLEKNEGFFVTYLPVDKNGAISLSDFKNAIQTDTILVSLMYVNNETGVISPIEEIGNLVKRHNEGCLFHVDAVQAVGKLPVNVKHARIDLLSSSAHKFHGPKGVGFLYKRQTAKVNNIVYGGGQELGLRSGTENVPGIGAMACALNEAYEKMEESKDSVTKIQKAFIDGISEIEGTSINGYTKGANSPYIVNASFKDVRSEVLIHALEEKGIYASAGSACSSHSKVKTGALAAMGLNDERLESAVRFSFNRFTKEDEIEDTVKVLKDIIPTLNKFKRK